MTTTSTASVLSTWHVDTSHSQVGFKVRHLGFSKVKGTFQDFNVVVHFDGTDLASLETEVTIQAASIDTGNSDRDNHLRSGDFFEAETFPTLEFKSRSVTPHGEDEFDMEGDLTIHGVTKSVVLKGEFHGHATDPWGNQRVAFEARTRINRKDFDLTWNQVLETGGLLVSEEVEITVDIQAVLAGENL
ncbi:MAG: YceI family protein [Ignavibacteriae bacterium]|nr:YceI family protein [Ignavibacteriota bacterium]MCB9214721.1 YceI family protein [Ignavibacteria bacterium]